MFYSTNFYVSCSKLTISESICNHIARTDSNCGLLMSAMAAHMKHQVHHFFFFFVMLRLKDIFLTYWINRQMLLDVGSEFSV